MKEFIDKLIERLEEREVQAYAKMDGGVTYQAYRNAIEIVIELAEEYINCSTDISTNKSDTSTISKTENVGWIACSERLPQTNDAVNITWINRKPEPYYEDIKDKPFTATGHYHNGKWYWFSSVCKDYLDEYGDSEFDRIDKDIEIVAWCELPAPYTEGE